MSSWCSRISRNRKSRSESTFTQKYGRITPKHLWQMSGCGSLDKLRMKLSFNKFWDDWNDKRQNLKPNNLNRLLKHSLFDMLRVNIQCFHGKVDKKVWIQVGSSAFERGWRSYTAQTRCQKTQQAVIHHEKILLQLSSYLPSDVPALLHMYRLEVRKEKLKYKAGGIPKFSWCQKNP